MIATLAVPLAGQVKTLETIEQTGLKTDLQGPGPSGSRGGHVGAGQGLPEG